MKFKYLAGVRPLYTLTDFELLSIVMHFTRSTFQVNSREIEKVEVNYSDDFDTSSLEFRITTIEHNRLEKLVCGFSLMFWDDQTDIHFTPYSKLVTKEEYLNRVGINEDFAPHLLGAMGSYHFFKYELKLWQYSNQKETNIVQVDTWKIIEGDFSLV